MGEGVCIITAQYRVYTRIYSLRCKGPHAPILQPTFTSLPADVRWRSAPFVAPFYRILFFLVCTLFYTYTLYTVYIPTYIIICVMTL